MFIVLYFANFLSGARVPRFDPTAYCKDRDRRKKESDIQKFVLAQDVVAMILYIYLYDLLHLSLFVAYYLLLRTMGMQAHDSSFSNLHLVFN